jgi:hypothetical protein
MEYQLTANSLRDTPMKAASKSIRLQSRGSKRNDVGLETPASLEGTQAEVWKDRLTRHMRTLRGAMHVAYTCDRALLQEGDMSGEQISSVMRLYCTDKIFRAMQETASMLLLIDGKLVDDFESDQIGRMTDSVG